MAFWYYKYLTDLGNTIIEKSDTSFILEPNEGQLYKDYEIPATQPLYLYRTQGLNIIPNTESNITDYLAIINGGDDQYTSKTVFQQYTGVTAPNTYLTKGAFNIFSGTTLPATYATKNFVTGSTGNFVTNGKFNQYTGTTLTQINDKLSIPVFVNYSANTYTILNNKVNAESFNIYTGTTLPTQYATKSFVTGITSTLVTNSKFSQYTGVTAPNTYLTKSTFNIYTGTTLPAQYATKSFVTGITNTLVTNGKFSSYTASTLTQINGKLSIITFSNFSGNTLPATYVTKTLFNNFTGSSGNGTITGGTNGLTTYGKNIGLGGVADQDTILHFTNGLTLTGTTTIAENKLLVIGHTITDTDRTDSILFNDFNTNGMVIKSNGLMSLNGDNGINLNTLGNIVLNSSGGATFDVSNGFNSINFDSTDTASISSQNSLGIFSSLIYQDANFIRIGNASSTGTQYITISGDSLTNNNILTKGKLWLDGSNNRSGLNVGSRSSDPSSLINGDLWYNSTTNKFRGRANGVTIELLNNTPFNTFTGTTVPNTYVTKVNFNNFTGVTGIAITGATNGLRVTGKKIKLGGNLTGSTTIGLGTNNLVLTGTTGTLRYGSDLSAQYNVRSLVDRGYVTGITNVLVTKTAYNTYTASTLTTLNNKVNTASFNTFTGTTNSRIITIENSYITGYTSLGNNTLITTKSGKNLQFKGLAAGTNITLTPTSTGITISASGGAVGVTGATNGLSVTGAKLKLGGILTGATTIALGNNNLNFTGGTGIVSYATTNGFASSINLNTVFNANRLIHQLTSAGFPQWNLYNTSAVRLGEILYTTPGGQGPGIRLRSSGGTNGYDITHMTSANALDITNNVSTVNTRVIIGGAVSVTPSATLQVRGRGTTSGTLFRLEDSGGTARMTVVDSGATTFNGRVYSGFDYSSTMQLRQFVDKGYVTGYTSTFTTGATNGLQTSGNGRRIGLGGTLTGATVLIGSSANTLSFRFNGLGVNATRNFVLENTTLAANLAQQISPDFVLRGQGWKTNATAASQAVEVRHRVLPIQGTANPTYTYSIWGSINNGAETEHVRINSGSGAVQFPQGTIGTPSAVNINIQANGTTFINAGVGAGGTRFINNAHVFATTSVAPTTGSTLVDFQSSTLGVIMPRVTSIASPTNAMVVYSSSTNTFQFRENGVWNTYLNNIKFNTYSGLTNTRLTTVENNYVTGYTSLGNNSLITTKSGKNLQFKGLAAGTNITLTPTSTGITISASGGGGSGTVTGATNGLRMSGGGKRTALGGVLTGATTIGLGTNNLTFTGTTGTLRYGSDLSAQYNIRSLVDRGYVTGITNSLLAKSLFNTFTGTTAPLTYQSKASIVILTGTTLPATYVSNTKFNTYTGSTNTRITSIENNFVTGYTSLGNNSLITTKSGKNLQFKGLAAGTNITLTPTSTGITISASGSGSGTVTGATNGLRMSGGGKRTALGGNLTGSTTIGLGTNNLTFTGTTGTLRYGSDLSAQYDIRSIVDKGYVTGITETLRSEQLSMGVSSSSAITVGAKGRYSTTYAGTIIGWRIISDQSTTSTVDVWKANNAIPTSGNTIFVTKPSLTTAQLNSASNVSIPIVEGDVFIFNVISNNNAKYLRLELKIRV